MKRYNILFLISAALLLAGCAKEPGRTEAGSITVEASIGQMTKVQYGSDGIGTSFTAGDKIVVYGWTGDATAVPATRLVDGVANTLGTDGKWTPESPMLWKNVKDQHYFLGVFPARTITDFTADAYTLDPANYEASDLLIATNVTGLKAQDNPVALTFEHALAKLNVNLKFRSQWETEPTVTSVTTMAKKTAMVNYLDKKLTATGTSEAVALTASANTAYSGLQVPQEGVRKVTVTINNKEYVYESATDIPLIAGQYTTLGLVVGKDKIELTGVTVSDWTVSDDLPGGEAELSKTINGHEYVDMGNGLKWATCNVGATNPEDYGDYFAWGETTPKSVYSWDTYFDTSDGGNTFMKYTTDKKTVLDAEDDAATANWGSAWRMPTDAEWTWLCDNCSWDWTGDYLGDGSNKAGRIVTSTINGNQIFLPAAGYRYYANLYDAGSYGYYWSSSLYESYSNYAVRVYFDSGGVYRNYGSRYFGQSVRPVSE